jgi:hypothetical protein
MSMVVDVVPLRFSASSPRVTRSLAQQQQSTKADALEKVVFFLVWGLRTRRDEE